MAGTNYPGNPAADEPPSPAPGPRVIPVVNIPGDGDGLNAASVGQALKTPTDFVGHIQSAVGLDIPVVNAGGVGFTAVGHTGSGTGSVTPAGATGIATGQRFVIKIIAPGAVGTATFQSSLDGGATFGGTQTTSASMTDATSGVTLAFAGTFVASDAYAFRGSETPLASWADSAGNVRSITDHIGYRRGRTRELLEDWLWVPVVSPAGGGGATQATGTRWTYTIPAGGGAITAYLGSLLDGNAVVIGGAPNASVLSLVTTTAPITYRAFSSIVLEWDMFLSAAGANQTDLQIGLNNTALVGTPSSAQNAITLLKRASDTNWQGYTANGSANTIQNLGVAPAANTPQRFLLELHGSSSPWGSRARFFINDALVGEIAATLPAANQQLKVMLISEGNGGASTGATVGQLRALWNPQLSVAPL